MSRFNIPTKVDVQENDQKIFSDLENGLGFAPNLYAYYTKSETALQDYLSTQYSPSTQA